MFPTQSGCSWVSPHIWGVVFAPSGRCVQFNATLGEYYEFLWGYYFCGRGWKLKPAPFQLCLFLRPSFPADPSPQLKCLPRQLKCAPGCSSTAGPRPFLCSPVFASPTLPDPSNLRVAGGLLYHR
eukprot:EG_transcript_52428